MRCWAPSDTSACVAFERGALPPPVQIWRVQRHVHAAKGLIPELRRVLFCQCEARGRPDVASRHPRSTR